MSANAGQHPTDAALQAYSRGRLEESAASSVDSHLEQCAECRRRVAEVSGDSFLGRLRGARPHAESPSRRGTSSADEAETIAEPVSSLPVLEYVPEALARDVRYRVIKELGRGGMGVVYLALNTEMDRREVLKVLNPEFLARRGTAPERFLREIRTAAKLNHPNIVTAYSTFALGELRVFAMEYVPGADLADLVRKHGPLPVATACHFTYQAALGLQHAHEQGTIHRDIKPSNLMVARQGQRNIVKILDFGLAKAMRETPADGARTHEGQALGTPDYNAPEQIIDARNVDIRADIYSLGCTLYHLLTGHAPFHGANLYDIFQAHISNEAKPLNLIRPEVPVELAALVAKMMAKERVRRFQAPGNVAQALLPFFKQVRAQSDSSPMGWIGTKRPRAAPTDGGADSTGTGTAQHAPAEGLTTSVGTPAELRWEDLIEFQQDGKPPESGVTVAPIGRSSRWHLAVFVAVSLIGLGALARSVGFRFKTPEGVLLLKGVPEGSELLVDGDKFVVPWPGVDQPVEIPLLPGVHRVEVRKDGFKAFRRSATVPSRGSEELQVRLEQFVAKRANTPAVENSSAGRPRAKVADATSAAFPASDHAPTRGLVPLFNGRDLDGWVANDPNNKGSWEVVGGVLVGRGASDTGGGPAYLVTQRNDYANFKLRVHLLNTDGRNKQLCVRLSDNGTTTDHYGVAVGGLSTFGEAVPVGSTNKAVRRPHRGIVKWNGATLIVPAPVGEWQTVDITAIGNRIATAVNGKSIGDYRDADVTYFRSGQLALICPADSSIKIDEIMIEELPRATAPLRTDYPLLFTDDFSDPFSGWPRERPMGGKHQIAHDYHDGSYFIETSATGQWGWSCPRRMVQPTYCRLKGRILASDHHCGWGIVTAQAGSSSGRGLQVYIDRRGRFYVEPGMFSSGKFPHDPRIGPRVHPAIHTGDSYNTVELMIQRRRLEVYVNSVRVCEPVVTDWDLVPYGSSLTIFNGQPGLARAEFDEIEFRALPANEN